MNANPRFQLPSFLPRLGGILPQWPHSLAFAASLNAARAAGVLRAEDLTPVEGRVVRVAVADAGITATVRYRGGLFRPVAASDPADVTFRGPLSTFVKLLARQEDPDTLFFHRLLAIEGDTELGLALKNMLDGIELPELFRRREDRQS